MKDKCAFWLTPETTAEAVRLYTDDNCASQSAFAEKALRLSLPVKNQRGAGRTCAALL